MKDLKNKKNLFFFFFRKSIEFICYEILYSFNILFKMLFQKNLALGIIERD